MLETRIDEVYLEEILGDNQEVILLTMPGGMSSSWYLYLKNFVAEADINPKNVFVFFRDYELTKPLYRTQGEYSRKLDLLSRSEELDFDMIINTNSGIGDKLSKIFDEIYPIQAKNSKARDLINRSAVSLYIPKIIPFTFLRVTLGLDDSHYIPVLREYKNIQNSTNDLFARKNFRSSEIFDSDENHSEFMKTNSFLNLMVNVSNNHQIELTFVRVQKRPNIINSRNSDVNLNEYIDELQNFLMSHDVNFIDLEGKGFGLEYYLDGDHIDPEYIKEFTEYFYRENIIYFGGEN
tara:strand:- start:562 stop:1440 length:879 start_codon:yes stop_codon:yes gene_type:complete